MDSSGRYILISYNHFTRYHHLALLVVNMVLAQQFPAFFYGTLLHPKILKRVIGNDGSHLEICPAVLLVSVTVVYSVDSGELNSTLVLQIGSHET